MRNNLANSPGMDDKTGLWVCVEGMRRAVKRGGLKVGLFAVSTVQEEIGLRGATTSAYGVNPHVGIAVDVTHATDCPTIDKTQEGDIKLGGGPVIYRGPNMNPIE
jgi:endoglucanase